MNATYPTSSSDRRLHDLHDRYVDAVNRAVAENRDDLVFRLVDEYPQEALSLMDDELPRAA